MNSGLLQLDYAGGIVTTICNKSYTPMDVDITCKGLGFTMGRPLIPTKEFMDKNSENQQPIVRLKPDCVGNETKVEDCPGIKELSDIGRPYSGCTTHMTDRRVLCSNEGMVNY